MTNFLALFLAPVLVSTPTASHAPTTPDPIPERVDRNLVAVRVVRDLDRDGVPDLCLRTSTAGRAEIALLSAARGKLLWRAPGPPGVVERSSAPMPGSIAALGDLDRDGIGDIAAIWRDMDSAGEVWGVVLAFHAGVDGRVLYSRKLPTPAWQSGAEAIVATGDLDGDILPDVLALSPARELTPGRLTALSSSSGEVLWSVATGCRGGGGDAAVAAVRDVDGDGTTDAALVVDGAVEIVSGRDGRLVKSISLREIAVSAPGADIVISAPSAPFEPGSAPRIADSAELRTTPGTPIAAAPPVDRPRESWKATGALLVVGDRDADGTVDLAVLERDVSGHASSLLIVSLGSTHGLGRIDLSIWSPELVDAQLRLAGLVDADRVNDLVLADPGWNRPDAELLGGVDAGRVRLVSGASGTAIHDIEGGRLLRELGRFSAVAGDVDRDGTVDVWFSARDVAQRPHDVLGLASGASGAILRWIDLGRIEGGAEE